MKLSLLPLLYISLSNAAAVPSPPTATNVFGKGVTYTGIYESGIEGFVGIRFAEDTGGQNRFKPPVPYTPPRNSKIVANDPGPSCPQRKSTGPYTIWDTYDIVHNISEDCLRLNVWRPNGTQAGDKLPVLVWIYGGSFITGNKDGTLAQPGGMQAQAIANGHPIMNVEINYRLAAFGFAQTDALMKEGSTNAGLRDQRAALEWVKANIAAFGGDPDRITIHGQSSGGLAVGMQILAYGGTKPAPFHQGICESQALDLGITGNFTRHAMARAWHLTSCSNLTFDSTENLECLRSIPMHELLHGELITHTVHPAEVDNDGDSWLPVVDGDFLPAAPSKLMAGKRFANVSVMIGWTDNDFMLFIPLNTTEAHQTRTWMAKYLPGLTEQHVDELMALYPASDFQNSYFPNGKIKLPAEAYRLGRMARDALFTCQPILVGQVIAEAGNGVYFYNQNQSMLQPTLHQAGGYGMGPVHTSELIYVFGNLSRFDVPGVAYHPGPRDFYLEKHESRSWSSFVATGQPSLDGHDTLPGWEQADFSDENYGVYVIGGPSQGYSGTGWASQADARAEMAKEKLRARCGFLNSPEIVKELMY